MGQRVKIRRRAVALRYDSENDFAPKVTAKGKGVIADKILDLARQHGVPIHPDRDLVEVLGQLDLDEHIPREIYVVVAEILAFIYAVSNANRK